MTNEYLAFVDEIGKTDNGYFIYRFDFTLDKDIVWGEYWNIAPANLVPNISPDNKCLSRRFKVELPFKMELACGSSCFSMQDCIDGIISLCFPDISEEHLKQNDIPLFFKFGENYLDVISKLKDYGINTFDENIVETGDKTALENLADGISNQDGDGDFNNNYDDEYDF